MRTSRVVTTTTIHRRSTSCASRRAPSNHANYSVHGFGDSARLSADVRPKRRDAPSFWLPCRIVAGSAYAGDLAASASPLSL